MSILPAHSVYCALIASVITFAPGVAGARAGGSTQSPFVFNDANGKSDSADVVTKYQSTKIVRPFAGHDQGIDPKLRRAATIAEDRAHAHSREQCWHAVKEALLASGIISSYPKTVYAKEAGRELTSNYGFKRISVHDPFKAPVGAVLVYGAKGAGHVELRSKNGFVSDFKSRIPSPRPLIGVYVKS